MTELSLRTGSLCRCCHAKGDFRSLSIPYIHLRKPETYSHLLKECFDIFISPPTATPAQLYSICDTCVTSLQHAWRFKQQVLECENKFLQYYRNGGKEMMMKAEYTIDVKRELSDDNSCRGESDNEFSDEDEPNHVQVEILLSEPSPKQGETSTVRENTCRKRKKMEENDGEDSLSDDEPLTTQRSSKTQKFSCNICHKQFNYQIALDTHKKRHLLGRTYKCYICESKFTTNKGLTRHIAKNHGDGNSFPCTLCKDVFDEAILLKNHLNAHFKPTVFKCEVCGKEFKRKQGLNAHMDVHTKEKRYKCKFCKKGFGQKQNLINHERTHTGERPYVCAICGLGYPRRPDLKRHIFTIHSGIKPHACTVCEKQFSSKTYLSIHQRMHTAEKPYSCDVCKKAFAALTTLRVHMRVHTGEKPYACAVCGRQFSVYASFKRHERLHSGEKPFACKICEKTFADNGYLRLHMRTHTADRPYTCNLCDKQFKEPGALKKHILVHTGEKLTCKICNKQISRNLTKHMRVHSGERPYSCNMCDKQFAASGSLKLHMRTHTGEKPYQCEMCNKQFSQSGTLKRHRCTVLEKVGDDNV
ncbi:zinc finger protein 260 isoform X1 [Plutella xylostella]|uniref:zinc finger protein 260 isoform X1 n=1 Tax=Plutella xylostella TaxID=51655 RepID=UPI0020324BB6|nr:zinc finger protein 260 isoform X1 [Plutella xylostella]